ncbi:WlaTC/HtrL family glycosyltransferase [Clostridium perfringens]|uniref:WlaTC/HtrL family glycosyltransferase n=1 Tax=Clostridium perfringens TaxID=1502 RepID=UPI0024BBF969|nr:WlaTC/HtrL family glycosyltransferase [Clostridium perfringens]
MEEITIVTAFFNINRESWNKFERGADQYLNYFSKWAKMKNKLIVFVENEELAKKIIEVRNNYNLGKRTIVNIIDDYKDIDRDLYNSIKKVSQDNIHKEFRLLPNNPEVWNYNYDYIMLLKMWCVKEAIKNGQANGMVAWVDFGYNHGGAVIDESSDFSFTWKYNFPEKINLFSVQDLDDRPIFDIVRSMDTYIMGTVIVGIDYLWNDFWLLMRESMMSLNKCGLMDDDQTVILMSYREKPEIFNIYKSSWHLPIKQFGGEHLKIKNNISKNTNLRFLVRKLKNTKLNFKYCIKTFNNLQKINRK